MAITKRQPEQAPGPEEKDFYDYLGSFLEVGGMVAGGVLAASATGGMSLAAMPAILGGVQAGRGVGGAITGLINPEKAEGNRQFSQGLKNLTQGGLAYAVAQPKTAEALYGEAMAAVKLFNSTDQTSITDADKISYWKSLTEGKPFNVKQNSALAANLGIDLSAVMNSPTMGAAFSKGRVPSPAAIAIAQKKTLAKPLKKPRQTFSPDTFTPPMQSNFETRTTPSSYGSTWAPGGPMKID